MGTYTVSRIPGYPIPEIAAALLWRYGPLGLNLATAEIGALAILFFSLSLQTLRAKKVVSISLALAFKTVVFINSTIAMDYVWALAFVLGAHYYVLIGKYELAGLFLGLTIGCRVTSAFMMLPLIIMLSKRGSGWLP